MPILSRQFDADWSSYTVKSNVTICILSKSNAVQCSSQVIQQLIPCSIGSIAGRKIGDRRGSLRIRKVVAGLVLIDTG